MWVKLKKYCDLTGDTSDAVHNKRRKGMWVDGKQCKIAADGNLWVNLEEVNKWVEMGSKSILQQQHQTA